MDKFIQIAAGKYHIYALDEKGNVWIYETHHREKDGEYQTVNWWVLLNKHRGEFPGWPLTKAEITRMELEEANREVEQLLK